MKKRAAVFSTAFIALVLLGSGCDNAERDNATERGMTASPSGSPMTASETSPTPPPGATGATHTVADITRAPNAMINKTVTVVADVDEVYGPRAFKLDQDSLLAGGVDRSLLTLVPKVGSFPNIDDQWKNNKARVTGVVHRMAPKNVEREIGWELPPNLEAKFKGKPVLIARSVERLSR
ncbi:MAG: hypothetical protein ACREAM_30495 [Blastocatellia bacterium]